MHHQSGSHFPNPRIASSYGFYHDDWDLDDAGGPDAENEQGGPNLEAPASVEVTVIRAADLRAADVGGTSDPYVTMQVVNDDGGAADGPCSQVKTAVKKRTLAPEWHETLKLELEPAQRTHTLVLECFDFDQLSMDDSLGRVEIELSTLIPDKLYTGWYDLVDAGGEEASGAGQLELKYRLTEKEPLGLLNARSASVGGADTSIAKWFAGLPPDQLASQVSKRAGNE